jgi:hypothetical protein
MSLISQIRLWSQNQVVIMKFQIESVHASPRDLCHVLLLPSQVRHSHNLREEHHFVTDVQSKVKCSTIDQENQAEERRSFEQSSLNTSVGAKPGAKLWARDQIRNTF